MTTLTVPIAWSCGTLKRGNTSREQDAWHLVSTASMPVVVVIIVVLLPPRTACGSGIWGFVVLQKTVLFICFLPQTDLSLVVKEKRYALRSSSKWIEMTLQFPCPISWNERYTKSGHWTTDTHLREASRQTRTIEVARAIQAWWQKSFHLAFLPGFHYPTPWPWVNPSSKSQFFRGK